MSIHDGLSGDLGGGYSAASTVGSLIEVDGHAYLLEPSLYKRETVAATRPPADQGAEPSEATFNPDAAWRRIQADWSWGSGQEFYDEPDSDRRRFGDSRRVDVFSTPNAVELLPASTLDRASANTGLLLLVAGAYLYLADGSTVRLRDAAGTWTEWAAGAAVTGLATDGTYVYVATTGAAVQRSTIGSTSGAAFGAYVADGVAFANGRLFAWADTELVELAAAGASTVVKDLTFGAWAGVCATPGPILAWTAEDLYAITVEEATGALNPPVVIGSLPRGETIRAVLHYLGWLVVATSVGVRVCELTSSGVRLGAAIDDPGDVACLDAHGRYVWFGWTGRAADSSALGRLDLGRFADPDLLVPAWASDLEPGVTGTVAAVVTFGGRRFYAVDGSGVWAESASTLVADGWIESSKVRFSTYDSKLIVSLGIGCDPLDEGSVTAEAAFDGGSWETIATFETVGAVGPTTPWRIDNTAAEATRLRFTLTRGATDGPVLRRWALRAYPQSRPVDRIIVPIHAKPVLQVGSGGGSKRKMDVTAELDFLLGLRGAGRVVRYVEGGRAERVIVEGVAFAGEKWDHERTQLVGIITLTLKTVEA